MDAIMPDAVLRSLLNLLGEYLTLAALLGGLWAARGWQMNVQNKLERICSRLGRIGESGDEGRRENAEDHKAIKRVLGIEHDERVAADADIVSRLVALEARCNIRHGEE